MSDVGERMLLELRRIREALEGSQPLGFGKKVGPTYVFVRHHEVGGETYFWYSRDKQEGQNVSIRERDLTGYLVSVWRFERGDDATGEAVLKLNVQIRADKDYVVQTGFSTNFAKTLLTGLLQLEPCFLVPAVKAEVASLLDGQIRRAVVDAVTVGRPAVCVAGHTAPPRLLLTREVVVERRAAQDRNDVLVGGRTGCLAGSNKGAQHE